MKFKRSKKGSKEDSFKKTIAKKFPKKGIICKMEKRKMGKKKEKMNMKVIGEEREVKDSLIRKNKY